MIEAYAVADVRAAEAAAMAGLPEGELMARAAQGLAAVVAARLEERQGMRVVGLVGPFRHPTAAAARDGKAHTRGRG